MEILTKRQLLFLETVGGSGLAQQFYLTGGTVLAGFYLKHRHSEDLDFFSMQEVDPFTIQVFLKNIQPKLDFTKIDYQQTYNRNLFFLHFPDGEVLKTEFTHFPFSPIQKGEVKHGVQLDSVEDIAVNKLFSIYQRHVARDYIDLYFLCERQGYKISELIKQARLKFDTHIDPLQLAAQFLKAELAKDVPRMIIRLKPTTWQSWFKDQAKNLKGEILTN